VRHVTIPALDEVISELSFQAWLVNLMWDLAHISGSGADSVTGVTRGEG
jgi:hypothetical protein